MVRFKQQVAIITGAARGIGFAIAQRLGIEGAKILIVDQDRSLGERAVSDLISLGVDAVLEVGDVGNPETAESSVVSAMQAWGRIDILINNAGIVGGVGNIWELPVKEMDRVYHTNLRSVFTFCHYVVPHMMKRDYGRIVNVASISGKEGNPKMVPYSSSKAGVIGLTKSVGKELARTGIRVNCVTPAVARTPLLEQIDSEQVQYMIERIPMGRTVEVEEIAALVVWIASSECSFSTGAVFDITGGRATY